MDKIFIRNLEVFANHGVFPEENVLGQKFVISVDMFTDTRYTGKHDELTTSIHYGEAAQFITAFLQEHTYKLIETAAEELAEAMLIGIPNLRSVRIELKKPWAPVRLPLETVGVEIERGWHKAYIALGSNIGDSRAYLDEAVAKLGEIRGCKVGKVAPYLVTKPYGGVEQDDFLNSVLELDTILPPHELLDELHRIEAEAGRERLIHWGPRTLDLDILLYDNCIIDDPDLHIPHIGMQDRDFVLDPLCEIAPYLRHPVLNKTIEQLKGELHGESDSQKNS